MIWLQMFMEELGKKEENSRLYCDSESAIHIEFFACEYLFQE
jgi:hypothetical protein